MELLHGTSDPHMSLSLLQSTLPWDDGEDLWLFASSLITRHRRPCHRQVGSTDHNGMLLERHGPAPCALPHRPIPYPMLNRAPLVRRLGQLYAFMALAVVNLADQRHSR